MPISEKVIFFSAMSVVDAKPLAINSIPDFVRDVDLLLLLLLLARFEHPPLGERDRLAQHVDVADVIGENENQRGVEIGALFVAQAAMRLDDGAKRVVGLGKIRSWSIAP